ncbi:MAG: hypothetical protein HY812_19305 [Planctomycetes bacterium]|nr:hypothetical protein [Planctomycetota bacterium]
MTDPLRRERLRDGLCTLAALSGLCGMALWAFAPLPPVDALFAPAPEPVRAPVPCPDDRGALDTGGFATADWWPALGKLPEPEGDPEAEGTFESWTLVAIVQGQDGPCAAVYVADEDALFVLRPGEGHGAAQVLEVEAREVRIRQNGTLYRLALDPGPRDLGPGGGP